jgi:predicted AAA+ superfamily ATPase
LKGYENDFAKHAPNEIIPRIRMIWNSIVHQLSKENKKFMYGNIQKGSRAKDFEVAIQWLVNAGLLHQVFRINKPTLPLSAYIEFSDFKLFFLDIGLINAFAKLDVSILLNKSQILSEYKGSLTEQFVFQELMQHHVLYYWTNDKSSAEIDFVFQLKNIVIPVEVKAEENLKAKSLKLFVEKFNLNTGIRTSMSSYREENWLTNIPLYAISASLE